VKNFWNSCIKKRLISQGLDPNTHNLISSHEKASINVSTLTSQLTDASLETKTPFVTIPNNSSFSSWLNPSRIEITNHENSLWGATREPFEAPRLILEGEGPVLRQEEQENKEENSIQIGEAKGNQMMDTSIFDCFNFDLGFVESTLMPGLMDYDWNRVDDLAWN
jgi:myb proto-oncogene protein